MTQINHEKYPQQQQITRNNQENMSANSNYYYPNRPDIGLGQPNQHNHHQSHQQQQLQQQHQYQNQMINPNL